MNKKFILLIPLFISFQFSVLGNNGENGIGLSLSESNEDIGLFDPIFYLEPYIGFSYSLAYGDYIGYHRSFHNVFEENTTFNGQILPLPFGTAGLQFRCNPFDDNSAVGSLGVSLGVQYFQAGFINKYEATYEAPVGYTDVTYYKETYRHHYLSIPILFSYGESFFGTLGFTITNNLSNKKSQKLEREQSGSGSLDGGFSTTSSDKSTINPEFMQGSFTHFILGGGYKFNEKTSLSLRVNFINDLTNEINPQGYKTILFEALITKTFEL